MKESLYLSGTINMTLAIIFLKEHPIYAIILLLLGALNFIFAEKHPSEQYNKKSIILTISIINLFLNPISGIVSLIGNDKLGKQNIIIEPKIKEKKETNKLDNLLKIGVALVSLSGIIFATTNWNIISSITKVIILLIFGIFFITLSVITEKKLKLIESSKGYWLLGILFTILTVLGAIYFEIIPTKSEYLNISLIAITTSLLSFITYKKYNQTIYSHITTIGIILSFSTILMYFNLSLALTISTITISLMLINILKPNELAKYLTYSSVMISLVCIKEPNLIELIILTVVSITNLIIIAKKEKDIQGILTPILINLLIIKLISQIETTNLAVIISLIMYSVLYLVNTIKIENTTYKKFMHILTNIAFLIITITALEDTVLLLLTTGTITLTSLISYEQKYEKILLPLKATTFILSIIYVMNDYLNETTMKLILVLIYLLVFIIHQMVKNKNIKLLSLIMYYALFFVSLITIENNTLIAIINIISSVVIYYIINKEQNEKKTLIAYINILLTTLLALTNINIYQELNIINYVLILLIYTALTLLTLKKDKYKKINSFAIILPLIMIIKENTALEEITKITSNALGMYLIVLLNTYLLKQQKDKQLVSILLSAFFLANIILIESWIIGLYVGLVSLFLIIYGFMKKEYKGLYMEGIIITIINIIYQFKHLWASVPLWLYLLFSGLIIIGIVTYKEIKEKNTSK